VGARSRPVTEEDGKKPQLLDMSHNGQGSHSPIPNSGLSQDFSGPQNVISGLCHSPAMFKNTDKQQLLTLYIIT